MTRPWVRLYRREEGAFAQLSLYARALAAELLKLTDDHGLIRIGSKEPHEAIAFALGATRSDRRLLKGHMNELLIDGYILHEGETLRVRNFPRFQDVLDPRSSRDAATKLPPSRSDSATTEPRSNREATTNEPHTDHEAPRKSSESQRGTELAPNTDKNREEEIRGEERGCASAPGSVGAILRAAPAAGQSATPDDAPCQVPELMEAMVRAVRRLVHDLYMAKLTYCHDLNGQEVQRLTLILRDMATARGEALPVVVERAVTGYLSDPYWQKARWPLYALVRHAARYADPVKPEDVKAVVATPKPDAKLASLRSKLAAAESQRQIEASLNPGGVAKLDEKIEGMRREMKRLEGAA